MNGTKIVELLNKWFKLLGIDPTQSSFSGYKVEFCDFIKQCKLSLDSDPDFITTLVFLKKSIKEFLLDQKINYLSIIENEDILKSLSEYKSLYLDVNSKEAIQLIDDFKKEIKEKVFFYKHDNLNNELEELLDNEFYLAELRFNSLNNLKNMQEFQFYKGSFSSEELKFSPFIYQFNNMNSLINSLCNSNNESLITISLIRDAQTDNESYFAFGIKNGQNVYVLTDKEKTAHPRQRYMRRSRGRDFVKRTELNMFPYDDVLDFDINYKGAAIFNNENEKNLVTFSNKPLKIKSLNEINSFSFVWIIMMLDVIKENYFTQTKTLSDMSYTGEMVFNKDIQKLNNKSLMLYKEKTIELKPVENDSLSHDLMQDDWESKPTGVNNWIEDKFKNQIDLSNLNLLENLNDDNVKTITLKSNDIMSRFNESKNIQLEKFKMTEFGTLKELKKTQRWIARYNQALNIEKLNQNHFIENKERVINWYINKLNENIDKIFEYIAKNELIVSEKYYPVHSQFENIDKLIEQNSNILNYYEKKDFESRNFYMRIGFSLSKIFNGNHLSQIENKNPSLVFVFRPVNVESLLKLCNVSFNDLPEELQHWTTLTIYTGNSILDNIDPMEWVVKNYWNKLNLSFSVYLTKTEYGDLRKKYGLENNKFWIKDKNG